MISSGSGTNAGSVVSLIGLFRSDQHAAAAADPDLTALIKIGCSMALASSLAACHVACCSCQPDVRTPLTFLCARSRQHRGSCSLLRTSGTISSRTTTAGSTTAPTSETPSPRTSKRRAPLMLHCGSAAATRRCGSKTRSTRLGRHRGAPSRCPLSRGALLRHLSACAADCKLQYDGCTVVYSR